MLQDVPTPTRRESGPCVLETERLTLRRPTLADVKAIARLANDRRIAAIVLHGPFASARGRVLEEVDAIPQPIVIICAG